LTEHGAPALDTRQQRAFGFVVGGGFAVIGLLPLILRGEQPRIWALAIALTLVAAGLLIPRALRPLHRRWMQLAEVLGWINTRIILLLVYYVIIVPTGTVFRIAGKDLLKLRSSPTDGSYRVARTKRPASHMQRQY
jgi:hypothetical protein